MAWFCEACRWPRPEANQHRSRTTYQPHRAVTAPDSPRLVKFAVSPNLASIDLDCLKYEEMKLPFPRWLDAGRGWMYAQDTTNSFWPGAAPQNIRHRWLAATLCAKQLPDLDQADRSPWLAFIRKQHIPCIPVLGRKHTVARPAAAAGQDRCLPVDRTLQGQVRAQRSAARRPLQLLRFLSECSKDTGHRGHVLRRCRLHGEPCQISAVGTLLRH